MRANSTPSVFSHAGGAHLLVGDARIYYELAGSPDGQPLLMLHGGLGDLRDWNPVAHGFAASHRLIGMDFRGHGRSTLGSAPLTYAQYQADVLALLDHLKIDVAQVAGFSDGGIVGYRLAAHAPHRVLQLVAVGAQWRLATDDPNWPMYQGLTSADWIEMFPQALPYYQQHNPEPDFERLLAAVKRLWTDLQATGYPGHAVAQIQTPTLLVRGDEDTLLDLQQAAALRGMLADCALLNIPFAGHEAHKDAPEQFIQTVSRFLNRA